MADVPQDRPAFLVNWHGWFPRAIWDNPAARFFHVIRDPRDILLSGWQYHQTAGPKGEKFLHTLARIWVEKPINEALNSIADKDEQILFEMRDKHAVTVQEMLDWPYDDPRQITIAYEDLMQDHDCSLFKSALRHLGFDQARSSRCKSLLEQSLFGGQSKDAARQGHVQSGAISRWATELPHAVGAAYEHEYGAALKQLGYSKTTLGLMSYRLSSHKRRDSRRPGEINR